MEPALSPTDARGDAQNSGADGMTVATANPYEDDLESPNYPASETEDIPGAHLN